MKKLIMLTVSFVMSVCSFGQDADEETHIRSFIDPAESRGYLCWMPVDASATYVIKTFNEDDDGVLSEIESGTTSANYFRLNTAFLGDPSKYYSISVMAGGAIIDESDIVPFESNIDATLECYRKCNGSTYAYELRYYSFDGGPDTGKMIVAPTSNYYDNAQGVVVPFYQAVSSSTYALMEAEGHPYAAVNANGIGPAQFVYKHVQITPSTPGTFYDKNNNVVTSGWLIEKKMDQFTYFNNGATTGDPGILYCLPGSTMTGGGGWMEYFNAYGEVFSPIPASVLPFAITVPTDLQCNSGFGIGGGGGGVVFGNTLSALDCIMSAIISTPIYSTINLDGCFEDPTAPGHTFTGISLDAINDDLAPIFITNVDGVYSADVEVVPGLYQVSLFYEDGEVLTTIVEATEERLSSTIADDVHLTIAPNPIERNNLSFVISPDIETLVNIQVSSLGGEVFLREERSLEAGNEIRVELEVVPDNFRYGQIVVTLIFSDGSTIQQIGLIE